MKFEDWWQLNHDPHTKGLDRELVDIVKRFSEVAWEGAQPKWKTIETAPKGEEVLYYNKSTEILCVGRRAGGVVEMRHDRVDLDYFTHWSHVVTPI